MGGLLVHVRGSGDSGGAGWFSVGGGGGVAEGQVGGVSSVGEDKEENVGMRVVREQRAKC